MTKIKIGYNVKLNSIIRLVKSSLESWLGTSTLEELALSFFFLYFTVIHSIHYHLFTGPSGAHGRPGDRGEPGRPGTYINIL